MLTSLLQSAFRSNSTREDSLRTDAVIPPKYFRDCINYEQKVAWTTTEYGQLVLSKRPVLKSYYEKGELLRLFKNKHWTIRLEEWLTLSPDEENGQQRNVPYGLTLPLTEDEKEQRRNHWLIPRFEHQLPLHEHFREIMTCYEGLELPTINKLELLSDGFTIVKDIIPPELIQRTQLTMQNLLRDTDLSFLGDKKKIPVDRKNQDPLFLSGSCNHLDLLALYYATPLYHMVEELLHGKAAESAGKATRGVRVPTGAAQVAFRFSQPGKHAAKKTIGGRSWHIDGLERGLYGSFSLLIGIPLNDQLQDFAGNFAVHPQSHYALQGFLKEYALQSIASKSEEERTQFVRLARIDLGEPVQVKMSAGDVVLALHKTAHLGAPNYSEDVRQMLFFRVSHRDHAQLRVAALDDIWIEYQGLQHLL